MSNSEDNTAMTNTDENEFFLMESILWEHCCGFWLLPEHLQRLKSSSKYFTRPFDEKKLIEQLDDISKNLNPGTHAIHVRVDREGIIQLSVEPYIEDRSPVTADLASQSIDAENIFMYHHTSNRVVYEEATASRPDVDEVLLWNDKGEVTESCTSNIIIEQDGQFITPPVSCGLLPGAYRSNLLQEERFTERPVTIDELKECDKVYLVNSLVGWREVLNWGQGDS